MAARLAIGFISTLASLLAQPAYEARNVVWKGEERGYRLLRPPAVEPGKTYPLILFLHGAGERGDDNAAQLRHMPEKMIEETLRRRFPCFVLAPQCGGGRMWAKPRTAARGFDPKRPLHLEATDEMLAARQALLDTVGKEPVDVTRVFLTGLSLGGYGSWELATAHPDWFAAVAPVCGGGTIDRAHRLVGVPVHAWHGSDDRIVPAERSREMIAGIREAGGNPMYREVAGVGHASWAPAYRPDGVFPWMFRQRNVLGGREACLDVLASPQTPWKKGDRLVFLGDSITEGGVKPGGYVKLIADAIARSGWKDEVEVIGAGISGHKVPDLEARLERDVISKGATLVFIYIGINDVWHGLQGKGTDEGDYAAGLERIIQRLKKTGADVVLATPTVIGERWDGTNQLDAKLETYASLSRKVAERTGVVLCDLRKEMLDALRFWNVRGKRKGVYTTDGVHLNDAGNRFLARHAALGVFEGLRARK